MDVPPASAPGGRDWGWSWPERILFGLVGASALGGALWLTALMQFALDLSSGCTDSGGWSEVFAAMAIGLGFAYAIGLCLALALSCLRICVGRRGLRTRSWLAVPALTALLALASIEVTFGLQADDPPPSPERCQPFEMS